MRTFFRYFDSKASVLWGELDSEITVITEALAKVPDSVPMMDAIRQARPDRERGRAVSAAGP